MIKVNETKKTRSIIIGNDLFDEYRKYEKHITLFGITLIKQTLVHNLDYTQTILSSKQIGFAKHGLAIINTDEETKKKGNSSH